MRQSATDAERVMWAILRRERLGERFRRQHQAAGFYLDFYCARLRIAVELDGEPHFNDQARTYDEYRTKALRRLGIEVIRFENREVIANPWLIEERIRKAIASRVPLSPETKKR
jgi:adenine-specific DNA-methyltransferase